MLASASMGPAFSLATTMGVMVAAAGGATPFALLLLTGVMVLVAIAFAGMIARHPDAGSSYAWVRIAFGEGPGAYAAWLLVLANFFAVMATALPAGTYTLLLVAPSLADKVPWEAAVGCVWILASAAVLRAGVRPSARVAAVLLLAELGVLGAAALLSAFVPQAAPAPSLPATAGNAGAGGAGGFVVAMVLGIWVVDGWEVSAATSEETRGDARSAGAGGLAGLLLTAAILILAMLAFLHAGGVAGIAAHQTDVLAYIGDRLGGWWRTALVVTVLVSLAASLETTLLYLVRSSYAMGRDGVLPRAFGRLSRRTGDPDPALAIVTVAVLAATLCAGFIPSAAIALRIVLDGSAIFLGLLFLSSCLAALRLLREERPLGAAIAAAALTAILAVALAQAEPATRWCAVVGMTAGIPLAFWHERRVRTQVRDAALRNIGGSIGGTP